MRAQRTALICLIAAMAALSTDAHAQKMISRGPSPDVGRPIGPGGGGGGFRGPGWGAVVPGIIMAVPQGYRSAGPVVDDNLPSQRRPQQANRQRPSGAPPPNERRFVPDEVVIELSNSVGAQQVDALQRRFRLTRIESQRFQLSNTTLYRWRIADRRSVAAVVRSLEGDRLVASAQPNYLFALQEDQATAGGDPAQYSLAKLHLPQAHALAKGANVLVAVIDSGVDANHPDLAGSVAETFDAISAAGMPHKHGTAIAGLIAAHGKLLGAAPSARILAVRAFDPRDAGAEGTTFNILKGIDWAASRGANVINMSFPILRSAAVLRRPAARASCLSPPQAMRGRIRRHSIRPLIPT